MYQYNKTYHNWSSTELADLQFDRTFESNLIPVHTVRVLCTGINRQDSKKRNGKKKRLLDCRLLSTEIIVLFQAQSYPKSHIHLLGTADNILYHCGNCRSSPLHIRPWTRCSHAMNKIYYIYRSNECGLWQ